MRNTVFSGTTSYPICLLTQPTKAITEKRKTVTYDILSVFHAHVCTIQFFSTAKSCTQQDLSEKFSTFWMEKSVNYRELDRLHSFFIEYESHTNIPVYTFPGSSKIAVGHAHWSSLTVSVWPIYLRLFIAGTCLPTHYFCLRETSLFPRSVHDYGYNDDLIHIIFGTCLQTHTANTGKKHPRNSRCNVFPQSKLIR